MNEPLDQQQQTRLKEAREIFSGRLLSDAQFDEAITITQVIEREIHKSGMFKEKLGDYAHAFARNERFMDAMKAESTVRDLFKVRTGQTMNQMREALVNREAKLLGRETHNNPEQGHHSDTDSANTEPEISEAGRLRALAAAREAGQSVKEGDKITFYRASTASASQLARDFGITDRAATGLMKAQFKAAEGRELGGWGKELEENHYRPQIKAEKAERKVAKENPRDAQPPPNLAPTRSRS